MKLKKIASLALAVVMAASLAVPVLAEDVTGTVQKKGILPESTQSEYTVTVPGEVYTPTIRVQVTPGSKVYVNPYGSTIKGKITKYLDGADDLEYSLKDLQLASVPTMIRNDTTDAKLEINVTSVMVAAIDLSTSTVKSGKDGYVSFVDEGEAAEDDEVKVAEVYLVGKAFANAKAITDAKGISATDYAKTSGKALAATEDGSMATLEETAKAFITVAAAQEGTSSGAADGSIVPAYGFIGIVGELSTDEGWTAEDAIAAQIVFTFVAKDPA